MSSAEDSQRLLLDPVDAGPTLHDERLWPGPLGWAVLLGIPVLAFLALLPRDGLALAVAGAVGAGIVTLGLAASGALLHNRVHRWAMVLGVSRPAARPYVVPWSTVDPSRVRLHHRANFIARRLRTQSSPVLRVAAFTTVAVTLTGLRPELAHPEKRLTLLRRLGLPGIDAETELREARATHDGWNLLTATWVIGTRDPERLLTAIEDALVASGHPEARGLAARELARPVVERWRHPLSDDEIYG
jgi:hypothetical protein